MRSRISSLSQPVKRTSSGKDASNRAPTDNQYGLSSSVDLQRHATDAALAQESFRRPCTPSPDLPPAVWHALNVVVKHARANSSTAEEVAAWYKQAYEKDAVYRHKRPSEVSIQSNISSVSIVSQNSLVSSATSNSNNTSYSNNASPTAIRDATARALSYAESLPCPSFFPPDFSGSRAPSISSDYPPRTPIAVSPSTSPYIYTDPRVPQEIPEISPRTQSWNWPIALPDDNNITEALPAPPKFFCTHLDCKVNEEGFSTKDIWINHEKTIHETLELYRCDQCDLVYRLQKRFRLHHKETHNCTGVSPTAVENSGTNQTKLRCSHAETLRVRDLPQKGAWGCPYCGLFLPKWGARINHIVKEHYMNHQVTRKDLSYTREILGLLNQPYVSASWSNLIQNRPFPGINWNNMPISKLKDMKKDLEFASHFKSDPNHLALTAFYWSSLGPQDSGLGEQVDHHSSNGSQITAVFDPLRTVYGETNELADRHQRVDIIRSPVVLGGTSPSSSTSSSLRKKKAHPDLKVDRSRPNSQEMSLLDHMNEPTEHSTYPYPGVLDEVQWRSLVGAQEGQILTQQEPDGLGLDDILELYRHER